MTVFVNAIMFYKVKDPISAVSNVDDYTSSARLLSATTLRDGHIFTINYSLLPIVIYIDKDRTRQNKSGTTTSHDGSNSFSIQIPNV